MARDGGGHRTRRGRRRCVDIGGGTLTCHVDVLDHWGVVVRIKPNPAARAEAADDGFDLEDAPQAGHVDGFTILR
jgi:hypothetical protein